MTKNPLLRVEGTKIVDGDGNNVILRGVALGGWMNMENFISGYSANETFMKTLVLKAIGQEKFDLFFEAFLNAFFDDADAQYLASIGMNCVRIPVNYRHFEDDAKPFIFKEEGFRHLDRVIDLLAKHGIYSVIDLHSLPGSQNHHWHSDNRTNVAAFWDHPHFQDRVVEIWKKFAAHYKGNPWVGGYNPMNEPADESRKVVGPLYSRLVHEIRAIDPDHILFLDGNTYSTEMDIFDEVFENTVYAAHDYAAPGLGGGGDYPGFTGDKYFDKNTIREQYLKRTEYCRKTNTPRWVGEFGPIYSGNEQKDVMLRQLLEDQMDIFREDGAGWTIWMYKDIGRQGVVSVKKDTPYRKKFDAFVAKKFRLGADHWGSDGYGIKEVTEPFYKMMENEFPAYTPYPWGQFDWIRTLILNLTVGQPMAFEYAEMLVGLTNEELVDLANSFKFENCEIRTSLVEQMQRG